MRTAGRVLAGPLMTLPSAVEARAVAGAVPGLLGVVPVHDAAQVRADRRELVQRRRPRRGRRRPCDSPRRSTAPESARDLVGSTATSPGVSQSAYCAATLRFSREERRRAAERSCATGRRASAQGFSRPRIRSVSSMPAIVPCVMPMPGVAGGDEDVRRRPRVAADEGQAVDGLHDLPGPAVARPLRSSGTARAPRPRAGRGARPVSSAWPVLWSSPPTIRQSRSPSGSCAGAGRSDTGRRCPSRGRAAPSRAARARR